MRFLKFNYFSIKETNFYFHITKNQNSELELDTIQFVTRLNKIYKANVKSFQIYMPINPPQLVYTLYCQEILGFS